MEECVLESLLLESSFSWSELGDKVWHSVAYYDGSLTLEPYDLLIIESANEIKHMAISYENGEFSNYSEETLFIEEGGIILSSQNLVGSNNRLGKILVLYRKTYNEKVAYIFLYKCSTLLPSGICHPWGVEITIISIYPRICPDILKYIQHFLPLCLYPLADLSYTDWNKVYKSSNPQASNLQNLITIQTEPTVITVLCYKYPRNCVAASPSSNQIFIHYFI